MRIVLSICFQIFFIYGLSQELNVTVDKNTAYDNEIIILKYEINEKIDDFIPPVISNFNILSGPFQSFAFERKYSSTKGRSSSNIKTTISYKIKARKSGKFEIQSASVIVNNKKIKSEVVKIEILESSDQTNNNEKEINENISHNDIFINFHVNKSEIYVGEQINAITKVYINEDIDVKDYQIAPISQISYNGFWEDEVMINTEKNKHISREIINGNAYNVITISNSILTSQSVGTYFISESTIDITILHQINKVINTIFGPRYFPQNDIIQKTISTNPKKIIVKNLPEPVPENFYGSVGSNFSINIETDKNKLQTSQAIRYKLRIRGNGNINMLDKINIDFPKSFEIFPPQIEDKTFINNYNISGSKIFEYILMPMDPGEFIIPKIKFVYFDLKKEEYIELESNESIVNVTQGKNYIINDNLKEESNVELLSYKKLYNKKFRENLINYFQNIFWIGILLSLLLFIKPYISIENRYSIEEIKKIKSTRIAMKRLKKAKGFLNVSDYEKFFEEIEKSLWGYFADKFNLDTSKLSKENININFNKKKIDNNEIKKFIKILNTCEFARYSPNKNRSQHMENTLEEAKKIIVQVESNLKKS
tara:strand:- start:664 stop:2454 length:1791 start_codon:yes stop_codon:yes gene_type:complete